VKPLAYLAILAGAYLLGSIPIGLLLSHMQKGIDIRRVGSGNIGATNVLRVLGKKAALITLIGDFLKGFAPAMIGQSLDFSDPWLALLALTPILGHVFPIFAGFRGGKGVATAIGVLVVIMPWVALWAFVIWIVALLLWRYVSLSSILATLSVPLLAILLGEPHPFVYMGIAVATLILYRHKANMSRLAAGTENRLGAKSLSRTAR